MHCHDCSNPIHLCDCCYISGRTNAPRTITRPHFIETTANALCPACNGNNSDTPCAFPEGGQPGCLKDAATSRAIGSRCSTAA